jgi:hypothetical protein
MRVAGRGASRARVIDPYGAREVSKWMPARSVVESREIVTKDHPAELPLAGRRLETCELAVVIAHGASLAKNSGFVRSHAARFFWISQRGAKSTTKLRS